MQGTLTQTPTHTHTCSELSLRILLWNASYVQKQSSFHLTGMGRWKDPTNSEGCHRHSQCWIKWIGNWPFPFNKAISLPTWQIAKTVQHRSDIKIGRKSLWKWRQGGSWVSHYPSRNWQNVQSMSVPIDITGSWWVSLLVPVSSVPPTPPALKFKIKIKKENISVKTRKTTVRSFTSIQMFHTHTHAPLPRGFFRKMHVECKHWLGHLGSDLLIKMPETRKRIEFILQWLSPGHGMAWSSSSETSAGKSSGLACLARVLAMTARWLPSWASSADVNKWMLLSEGSARGIWSNSRIGALNSGSANNMLYIMWASWLICIGTDGVGSATFTWSSIWEVSSPSSSAGMSSARGSKLSWWDWCSCGSVRWKW